MEQSFKEGDIVRVRLRDEDLIKWLGRVNWVGTIIRIYGSSVGARVKVELHNTGTQDSEGFNCMTKVAISDLERMQ